MASLLTKRQQGSLPSTSKVNPRIEGKEQCKVITLRSGKELATPGPPLVVVDEPIRKISERRKRRKKMRKRCQ